MEKRQALVQIKDLRQYFDIGSGKTVHSLNGINLDIYAGEALGIVGESGCGKSTLGKEILKINQPTNGEILYDGKWVAGADYRKHRLTHKERKEYCKKVQVVFQDPYSSLNPRHTAGKAIMRGLKEHRICPGKEKERTAELFRMVGLPEEMMNRYPHEFSGGQRQRYCQSTCHRTGTSHLRRTDIGIGCVDPVTDHQPSVQTEGRIGTDHDVHLS